jgi:hypothetical protein
MGKKKALSKKYGGSGTLNVAGPFLPDNLYELNYTDRIKGLKKIYDDNLEQAEKELNTISKDLKNLQDVKDNEDKRDLKLMEVRNDHQAGKKKKDLGKSTKPAT